MVKLTWIRLPYPHTPDNRFSIRKEGPTPHETVWHQLDMSKPDYQIAVDYDIQIGWYGKGGLGKCKEAAQRIATLSEACGCQ
jgi:hypothetical protein